MVVLFDTRSNFLGNDVMMSARQDVIIQSEGSSMRQDPGTLFSVCGGGRQGNGQCTLCLLELAVALLTFAHQATHSLDRRFTLFSERSFF